MRHTFTVILLFLTIISTGQSQIVRGYGLKLGTVLAGQEWTYKVPIGEVAGQHRWGLDFGPFIEFLNIPVFSLLLEAHYVQRGFSEEFLLTTEASPEGIGTVTYSPRIDYLSIPLLAKLRIDAGPLSPFVTLGPRLEFLLNTEPEGYEIVLGNLKSTDVGITVGAGVEWAVTESLCLGVEGRYSPGLQDVFSSQSLTIRNRSFEFLLSIRGVK